MESAEDLTRAEFNQALDQSWTNNKTAGADLLTRMRDSLAAIDIREDKPKLTKEQFLAEMASGRS